MPLYCFSSIASASSHCHDHGHHNKLSIQPSGEIRFASFQSNIRMGRSRWILFIYNESNAFILNFLSVCIITPLRLSCPASKFELKTTYVFLGLWCLFRHPLHQRGGHFLHRLFNHVVHMDWGGIRAASIFDQIDKHKDISLPAGRYANSTIFSILRSSGILWDWKVRICLSDVLETWDLL